MPLFKIACTKCSFIEEKLFNIENMLTYLRLEGCPRCEGTLERLPTSASIRIKDGTPKFGGK